MAEDLYTKWLGIEPGDRPVDYYTLLGIDQFCIDVPTIERAIRRQMDSLDKYALHPDREMRQSQQRMINEVAKAGACLTKPQRKQVYDRVLRAKQAPSGFGDELRGMGGMEILDFESQYDN